MPCPSERASALQRPSTGLGRPPAALPPPSASPGPQPLLQGAGCKPAGACADAPPAGLHALGESALASGCGPLCPALAAARASAKPGAPGAAARAAAQASGGSWPPASAAELPAKCSRSSGLDACQWHAPSLSGKSRALGSAPVLWGTPCPTIVAKALSSASKRARTCARDHASVTKRLCCLAPVHGSPPGPAQQRLRWRAAPLHCPQLSKCSLSAQAFREHMQRRLDCSVLAGGCQPRSEARTPSLASPSWHTLRAPEPLQRAWHCQHCRHTATAS